MSCVRRRFKLCAHSRGCMYGTFCVRQTHNRAKTTLRAHNPAKESHSANDSRWRNVCTLCLFGATHTNVGSSDERQKTRETQTTRRLFGGILAHGGCCPRHPSIQGFPGIHIPALGEPPFSWSPAGETERRIHHLSSSKHTTTAESLLPLFSMEFLPTERTF